MEKIRDIAEMKKILKGTPFAAWHPAGISGLLPDSNKGNMHMRKLADPPTYKFPKSCRAKGPRKNTHMKKLLDYWFYALVAALFAFALLFGCEAQYKGKGFGEFIPGEPTLPVSPKVVEPTPEVAPPLPVPEPLPEWSVVDPGKADCDDYLNSACRLRGGGSGGSGACFKIDDKYVYVLTCRHVVTDKGRIIKNFKVEFWLDGRITGEYAGQTSKWMSVNKVDAAVILIPVSSFKEGELPTAIPISTAGPDKDKPIMSVGCPGLSWQSLFEGHITKMNKIDEQSFMFVPPPKGGRSGSAIFQDGKIVGVLWGRSDKEGRGYAVNSKDLKDLTEPTNLFFTAVWCQYCREMEPTIEALKADGLKVQIVDYDLNTAFAELYGIKSLPAYVNQRGETISGVKSAEELQEFYGE